MFQKSAGADFHVRSTRLKESSSMSKPKRNEAVPKSEASIEVSRKRDLSRSIAAMKSAKTLRTEFSEWLHEFDPESQEIIESAYLAGQQVQTVQMMLPFQKFAISQMSVAMAVSWIASAATCANGPNTRGAVQVGVNKLISALSDLDITIQQINNDPDGTLYVNPEFFQNRAEELRELIRAAREFAAEGALETDRRLAALQKCFQRNPFIAEVMNMPISRRGSRPKEVLKRIDPVIYKFSQAGMGYAEAVNRAFAHFLEYGDQEAADYLSGITDRKQFGRDAITRCEKRLKIAES